MLCHYIRLGLQGLRVKCILDCLASLKPQHSKGVCKCMIMQLAFLGMQNGFDTSHVAHVIKYTQYNAERSTHCCSICC